MGTVLPNRAVSATMPTSRSRLMALLRTATRHRPT